MLHCIEYMRMRVSKTKMVKNTHRPVNWTTVKIIEKNTHFMCVICFGLSETVVKKRDEQ